MTNVWFNANANDNVNLNHNLDNNLNLNENVKVPRIMLKIVNRAFGNKKSRTFAI